MRVYGFSKQDYGLNKFYQISEQRVVTETFSFYEEQLFRRD